MILNKPPLVLFVHMVNNKPFLIVCIMLYGHLNVSFGFVVID